MVWTFATITLVNKRLTRDSCRTATVLFDPALASIFAELEQAAPQINTQRIRNLDSCQLPVGIGRNG